MTVTPAAAARLAEQFDLIAEIGRNMAAAPAGPVSTTAPVPASTGTGDPATEAVLKTGDGLLGDRLEVRQPRSSAQTLIGLRPPFAAQSGQKSPQAAMDRLVAALVGMQVPALQGSAKAGPPVGAPHSANAGPSPHGAAQQPAAAERGTEAERAAVPGHHPVAPATPVRAGAAQALASPAAGAAAPEAHAPADGPVDGPADRRDAARSLSPAAAGPDTRIATSGTRMEAAGPSAGIGAAAGSEEKPVAVLSASPQAAYPAERIARGLIAAHPLGLAVLGETVAGYNLPAERAGILASFVLNAHFLPGWPPLRPIESPQARSLLDGLAAQRKADARQAELLAHLVRLGLDRRQMERTLRLMARERPRSRVLGALAAFLTSLGEALRLLSAEIEAATDELQAGNAALTRAGRRARVDLG